MQKRMCFGGKIDFCKRNIFDEHTRPPPAEACRSPKLEKALRSAANYTRPAGAKIDPPYVSRGVFMAAVEALVAAIIEERVEEGLPAGTPLTKEHFSALAEASPKNADGKILYDGFASCLRVVDTQDSSIES